MSTPPDDLVLVAVAVLWGAVTGALLPRAAYRFSVPEEEADGGWRRTCPAGHPIRGWVGGARCARCARSARSVDDLGDPDRPRAPFLSAAAPVLPSAAAPVLPAVTAGVCAVLAAATGLRPELAVWLLLAPLGVLLAVVDLRVQRLPDPLTLTLAAAALALLGPTALLPEHAGHWTTALLGTLVLGGGYLLLHLVSPAGLAFGDVKLALGAGAVLGWYGWPTVTLGALAGFLLGALYGGALVVAGRAGRRTVIPFGPFMLAGTLVGMLIGAYAA
ncbi:A24 family peptidase [Streptomyces sp. NBC_01275]|uniref:prepilin peptidase n=1 Tax=Streptomyces sp. NBC_01275 TaxID=2903807 RepID=UPI002253D447|nr:A24 family peptidase [Streptomyces sp. NBC_01275]MCX4764193.1 A24 family peptidase [Streptomyces sp. NBC_01275]